MVATLLRLRFRVLGNQLLASPWQLIGFIVGMLWAAGFLLMVWAGLIAAEFAVGADLVTNLVRTGGIVLLLGWTLGPVLVAGVDTTLDPDKLAPFPISTRRMMVALTAAGLTGVPGIATVAGSLAVVVAYVRWPAAAAVAVVCVVLGVVTCVLASRLIAALMSGAGGNRRTREIIGGLAFLLVILIGPIFFGLTQLLRIGAAASGGGPFDGLLGVVAAIGWTPLGAAWAVPGDVVTGDLLPGVVKLAIAIATPLLLWWLWERILVSSQGAPVQRTSRRVKAGKLGWFGRLPSGPTGASWARSQTYWLHDPRYLRQLLVVPIFPVLMLVYSGGNVTSPLFAFSALVLAFVLGVVPYVDVSYDGTAFASVLSTGVRGRQDRAGRMFAAATVGIPVVVVVAVVTVALSQRWELLAPVLGASVGMLLTGFGVCAVSSALLAMPVPAPGDSPFKRVPGTNALMGFVMLGIWVIIGVLGSPAVVLAIITGFTGNVLLGWIALLVGVVLGTVFFTVGILLGGRLFDRNAPELLTRLRAMQHS